MGAAKHKKIPTEETMAKMVKEIGRIGETPFTTKLFTGIPAQTVYVCLGKMLQAGTITQLRGITNIGGVMNGKTYIAKGVGGDTGGHSVPVGQWGQLAGGQPWIRLVNGGAP